MIIQVQRVSGLANRTFNLSVDRVRRLRRTLYVGGVLLAVIATSWVFLAAHAARVPVLSRQLAQYEQDAHRR